MKRSKFLPVLILSTLMASACAPQAAPTVNPADVQSTAVAAAFTVVAETQAAIPTATPVPPTKTSTATTMPTETGTPVALPSLDTTSQVTATTAALSAPTTSGNATVDPCANRVLSYSPRGRPTTIRIVNTTRTEVTVSLYLNETASHGECGYRSYVIGKANDVVISDLVQGCYNLWAFSTSSNNDPVNAFGSGCINNPDKWTFEIEESSIKFVGP